jgi:DNA-directed RNA polymerase specialized sigma24 family protein
VTGDRSTAEDLLQEVLAKSWAYAQRGPIEQPGAFLRRCLVDDYVAT